MKELNVSQKNRLDLFIVKKSYHYFKKAERVGSYCSILVAMGPSRNSLKEIFIGFD